MAVFRSGYNNPDTLNSCPVPVHSLPKPPDGISRTVGIRPDQAVKRLSGIVGGGQVANPCLQRTATAMVSATFRFYEELNDFLAPGLRKRSFVHTCARRATVKQATEALGVPHTEVEMVLINGESVDFSRIVGDGDRIAVYPQFEALDISDLIRVRDKPLRRSRFVADAHLGLLAKYLRILGFDTVYARDLADSRIAALAAEQRRVVLTRDRALLMHRCITHGVYIRHAQPKLQLEQVVDRLDLLGTIKPFTRCLECNAPLERADEEMVAARVPAGPRALYHQFHICGTCDRVYWQGSHYRHMQRLVDGMLKRNQRPEH